MKRDDHLEEHKRAERSHWRIQSGVQIATTLVSAITLLISVFALRAAIDSANYSHIQADVANRTLTEVQRAFVVVDGLELKRIENTIEKRLSIHVKIRNAGSTPTRYLAYSIPRGTLLFGNFPRMANGIEVPNVPNDPAFIFYAVGHGDFWDRGFAVIGPQASLPLSPIEFRYDFRDRRLDRGAIAGAIVYNDIFPSSPRHITKFCYFIYPDTDLVTECGHWNCTDKECERDVNAYNDSLKTSFQKTGRVIPEMLARIDWLENSGIWNAKR